MRDGRMSTNKGVDMPFYPTSTAQHSIICITQAVFRCKYGKVPTKFVVQFEAARINFEFWVKVCLKVNLLPFSCMCSRTLVKMREVMIQLPQIYHL